MARLPEEFVKWELGASAVDFKVEYVDIAGDLIAGLMLSQIVWSYLPTTKRPLVSKKGEKWLVKGESEWYDECRLSKKRVRRGLETLRERELIEVCNMPHYRRKNISHIRLNVERFCQLWQKFADLSSCPNGAEKESAEDSTKANGAEGEASNDSTKSNGAKKGDDSTKSNGAEREPSNDSNKSNEAERAPRNSTQRAPSIRDFGDFKKTLTFDEHVFSEVLEALTTLNQQLESMNIKPLIRLPYLAEKIASRGDGVKEMRQAWLESCQNGDIPIAAFVTWITYGKVPAKRTKTTRKNPQTGKMERWRPNVGWVEM